MMGMQIVLRIGIFLGVGLSILSQDSFSKTDYQASRDLIVICQDGSSHCMDNPSPNVSSFASDKGSRDIASPEIQATPAGNFSDNAVLGEVAPALDDVDATIANVLAESKEVGKGVGNNQQKHTMDMVKALSSVSGNGGMGDAMAGAKLAFTLVKMLDEGERVADAENFKKRTEKRAESLRKKKGKQEQKRKEAMIRKQKIAEKKDYLNQTHEDVMDLLGLAQESPSRIDRQYASRPQRPARS